MGKDKTIVEKFLQITINSHINSETFFGINERCQKVQKTTKKLCDVSLKSIKFLL